MTTLGDKRVHHFLTLKPEERFIDLFCDVCGIETKHINFLDVLECGICNDKKVAMIEQQEKKEQERKFLAGYDDFMGQIMISSGADHNYLSTDYLPNEMKIFCDNIDNNIKNGKNIVMIGSAGRGKTTKAVTIGSIAYMAKVSVLYLKAFNMSYLSMNAAMNVDLLIIDEIHRGVKMFGEKPSNEDSDLFYQIYDFRMRNKKSTITIGNKGSDFLKSTLSHETVDRMNTNAIIFKFDGASMRQGSILVLDEAS